MCSESIDSRRADSLRRQHLYLLLIVLLALAVRCLSVYMRGTTIDRDTLTFLIQARSLLEGDVHAWFAVHRKPPLYSALVAIPAALGLPEITSARLIGLLAGIAILHPAWLFLKRCGDSRTALIGLAMVAMMKEEVRISSRCISDTTYAVLTLYALYFFIVRGLIDRRVWALGVAGALVGLAYLTRTEGLMFMPFGVAFILVAAVRKKLPARVAAVGGLLFVVAGMIFIASHVAAVSFEEGRFTLRRNMGHFMLYSIGVAGGPTPFTGKGPTAFGVFVSHFGLLIKSWASNFLHYFHSEIPRAGGYVSPLFLLLGLVADRKKLWKWGTWQLGLAMFLLVVMGVSIIEPHTRFLVGVIVLTGWPMARGVEAISEGLIRTNPLRLKRTGWVRVAIPLLAITAVSATSLASTLKLDRYENREFLGAAEVVIANSRPGQAPRIAVRESAIAYHAGGVMIGISGDWKLTPQQIYEVLERGKADFLVIGEKYLQSICPALNPRNPPSFLRLISIVRSHPRSREHQSIFVYRFAAEPATSNRHSGSIPVSIDGVYEVLAKPGPSASRPSEADKKTRQESPQ